MTKLLECTEPRIRPIYWQDAPSQPIELCKHPVELTWGGKVRNFECNVQLRLSPKARLTFEVVESDEFPVNRFEVLVQTIAASDDTWDGKLKLIERGVQFEALYAGTGRFGLWTFRPRISVVTATKPTREIQSAIVHLFNFPEFFDFDGGNDYFLGDENGGCRCGRALLNADSWRIEIAATDMTDEQTKGLAENGGFAITHMVKIEREDESTFSSEALENLLHCLHQFLSFALGRWAGLAFPIGFDEAGNRVFEQWGLPMTADGRWSGGLSWFDSHHGSVLSEVFPGFCKLWSDEAWRSTVQECLYWYVAANDRGTGIGVDTGLILTQTAFERLAWSYCVKFRKMVSPAAFKPGKLTAADKLRLLVSALGVPLVIPPNLPALAKGRGNCQWEDSLHAITEIRNSIVHPDSKTSTSHEEYIEAWKLSLWLLELCLLRLCDHNGRYGNRLSQRWAGQTEPVPWNTKPDSVPVV
jgi:hypothetical protein